MLTAVPPCLHQVFHVKHLNASHSAHNGRTGDDWSHSEVEFIPLRIGFHQPPTF